jgi:hypothetical protein
MKSFLKVDFTKFLKVLYRLQVENIPSKDEQTDLLEYTSIFLFNVADISKKKKRHVQRRNFFSA